VRRRKFRAPGHAERFTKEPTAMTDVQHLWPKTIGARINQFSSSTRKHSQRNAELSGEFVFNLATYDLRVEMNITGSDHAEELSEADLAGLEMAPSRVVKPPRVARSPIALECIYNKTIDLVQSSGRKAASSLVIGEVVNVHIDDAVIVDGNIDMARIRPLARLGYMDYTAVDNIFAMNRVPARQA
jgi:flavin reductase (DIM6/NTAB) family NADH-FMN oxidoreductase RutF